MTINITNEHFSQLLKATEIDYFETLKEINNCDIQIAKDIEKILSSIELKTYSSIKYFLVKHIYDLFYITELNTDNKNNEIEIFDFWNESNFTAQFSNKIEKINVKTASIELVPLLQNKIYFLFYFHIENSTSKTSKTPFSLITEFGDQKNIINLPEKGLRFNIEQSSFIPIDKTPHFTLLPSFLEFEGENSKTQIKRVSESYQFIKEISPELFLFLTTFTSFIVPTNEEQIVSHSTNELPGFSTINLVHRDDIDLIDDLIHENGHHFLNHYLNYQHLIDEDDEMDYFSPWRDQPRSIRGIFHAYMTFYWAFYLFKKIIQTTNKYSNNLKCHFRFLEEYYMLIFSYNELLHAYEEGKVTNDGFILIQNVNQELEEATSLISNSEAIILKGSKKYFNELTKLKAKLNNHIRD